jgi:hypothetical protein
MDFKSLINKLDSMDAPPSTPKAPELPKAVQLNEDAQLRVLSGRTTYVAEAKKMKEAEEELKTGDSKKTSTGGTVTKTKTGLVHKSGNNYSGKAAEKEEKKKTDESIEEASDKKKAAQDKFKAMIAKKKSVEESSAKDTDADKKKKEEKKKKIAKIVDEGSKPDFLDMDKDGDKKEPMKKAAADKSGDKPAGKKGMSDKQAKYFGKKVDEAKKDHSDNHIPDRGYDGDLEEPYPTKSKPHPKGHLNKLLRKRLGDPEKKTESKMMPKGKKRPVKESVGNILSFKEMLTLVRESGGQQQIDPVDRELFAWAQRVAVQKLGEGVKAEVYAGMTYERMGGTFEMYDVLAETK